MRLEGLERRGLRPAGRPIPGGAATMDISELVDSLEKSTLQIRARMDPIRDIEPKRSHLIKRWFLLILVH